MTIIAKSCPKMFVMPFYGNFIKHNLFINESISKSITEKTQFKRNMIKNFKNSKVKAHEQRLQRKTIEPTKGRQNNNLCFKPHTICTKQIRKRKRWIFKKNTKLIKGLLSNNDLFQNRGGLNFFTKL
jgi:hypothetical protein